MKIDPHEALAARFEANRTRLRAVALRMLGSRAEADDAVQEAWLRLSRTDVSEVANLEGWLTTVVARVCLDVLRARASRREEELDSELLEAGSGRSGVAIAHDAEREALLAAAVGPALQVVLETLAPAERLAFVLHDMFAVPFDDIAAIVGRSAVAVRQLASRARRRVQGAESSADADRGRQRAVVAAFLAASREGDFSGLLSLLAPDVVCRADAAAVLAGAQAEVRGADAVAETFRGRARFAELALLDGGVGAVWAPGGKPRVAFAFTIAGGKIVGIELLAGADRLHDLDVVVIG